MPFFLLVYRVFSRVFFYLERFLSIRFYKPQHTLFFTGHLVYAFDSNGSRGITTMVSSVQKSPETEQCLSFYFAIIYERKLDVNLTVNILTGNQRKVIPVWSAIGASRLYWEYGTVPISLKEPYKYSFVASKGDKLAMFLLDDISVQNHRCPAKLTCTFTNGSLCGWTNPTQHGIAGLVLTWMVNEPYPEFWSEAPIAAVGLKAEGTYSCDVKVYFRQNL